MPETTERNLRDEARAIAIELQNIQTRLYAVGLHKTAHALNAGPLDTIGWETADKLREMTPTDDA